jgi:hypothetical protein
LSPALATIVLLAAAADSKPHQVATNGALGGDVELLIGKSPAQPLSFGEELPAESRIRTGKLGFARMDFVLGGGIRLAESSELVLHERPPVEGEPKPTENARRVMVSIEKGVGRAFLTPGVSPQLPIQNGDGSRSLLIARGETPVQVRLTRTAKGTEVALIQGSLALQVTGNERLLAPGQFTEVVGGEAGEPQSLIGSPAVTEPGLDARYLCQALIVRFAWSPVPGAAGYRVQIARDPGFQQLVVSDETAATRHVFLPREPGRYVFRVASRDAAGRWSEPSDPRPLHCEKSAPEDFLISPEPGAAVRYQAKAPPLSFTWASAPGAPTYRFVLAKSPDLEATALVRKTSQVAKIEIDPLPDGDYFWGVYLEDPLPYPMFLAARPISVRKAGHESVTAPNRIKDWGK